ncbi:protein rogdi homolog isoform X2 [Lagenorhynchus albirostris]|uniref:protein rogdi homolog isoform X2 n=1 Tax=Lagenorhynchus albirostris TaxID=27610 RepID=UPI0028EAA171|nr:protein rogdi homolog isoform X2 [Lagenorhynchus albirostris]
MATVMAATAAERAVLEEEFRWLLHDEVHAVLRQLQDILKEASLRFTLPGSGTEGFTKQENFILGSCGTDQVKGVLTLQGDALSQADVNLKMPRNNQLLHFAFREDKQWKLQQIQDARNHVSQAIYLLANREESYQFRTGAEVLKRMFAPALPSDLLVNVYISLNKLCLTVYQLHALQPNSTKNFRPAGGAVLHSPGAMFEWGAQRLEVSHVHKVECVIPWLNDALVFFTVSLQLCQQLKDKVGHGVAWQQYPLPDTWPLDDLQISPGSQRVQQGPDPLAPPLTMSPHLPPSPDLCVLQLLELQAFLNRAPKSLSPWEWPLPRESLSPPPPTHTHT